MVKKKPGHTPERTCIGCGKKGQKSDFLRVVRLKTGGLEVTKDPKVHGRSAYICPNERCIKTAVKKIDKAIKIKMEQKDLEKLKEKLISLIVFQGEEK